jgi:hypothetical protein
MSIEHQAARFLADIAVALESVKSGRTTYGELYVIEVHIGFDGADAGLRVVANEHGGYDIAEVES